MKYVKRHFILEKNDIENEKKKLQRKKQKITYLNKLRLQTMIGVNISWQRFIKDLRREEVGFDTDKSAKHIGR